MFIEIPMYLREGFQNHNPQEVANFLRKNLVSYINTSHINSTPVARSEISPEDQQVHIVKVYPILTYKALSYPNNHCYSTSKGNFTKIPVFVDYSKREWENIKDAMRGNTYRYKINFESALSDILRDVHKDSPIVSSKDRNTKDFIDFSTFLK